jgi:hypothetical protein
VSSLADLGYHPSIDIQRGILIKTRAELRNKPPAAGLLRLIVDFSGQIRRLSIFNRKILRLCNDNYVMYRKAEKESVR